MFEFQINLNFAQKTSELKVRNVAVKLDSSSSVAGSAAVVVDPLRID